MTKRGIIKLVVVTGYLLLVTLLVSFTMNTIKSNQNKNTIEVKLPDEPKNNVSNIKQNESVLLKDDAV